MNCKKVCKHLCDKASALRTAFVVTLMCGVPVRSAYAASLNNPILSEAIDMLRTVITWGGIALMVWGIVDVGRTYAEQSGQGDASRGFWKILGGALVWGSTFLLGYIK